MKKWVCLCTLLAIFLTACGVEGMNYNNENPTIDEIRPPEVIVTTSNATYNMVQGGYEWTIEGSKKEKRQRR